MNESDEKPAENETPESGDSSPDESAPEEPAEQAASEKEESADSETAGEATGSAEEEAAGESEEDLPEWEPLTPELVEDEAIRGDFVLRWAVILLALLLGCTEIYETTTLVHVKTGAYLLENGLLPPRTDVFSYTAADRAWINLSWLFDLLCGGAFALAGEMGLSFAKALLAALIAGFVVCTSKRDVPTWWNSVCAGIALLAWYPQFTMRPEIITLLGLAVTLWLINRWREEGSSRALWGLVPVFLLWSNLDGRMFLGLVLLVLYALGRSFCAAVGRGGEEDRPQRLLLWKVVAACFVAALINPFGWYALLSPLSLYGVEYPAFRESFQVVRNYEELQYFSLVSPRAWELMNHRTMAGLFMLLLGAVSFALNWERVDFGELFAWLGFFVLAVVAAHELAAAAVVSCVIASLGGQDWYRHSFRQTYSVEFSELLFSRAGRAITVLGLFGIAYLTISGRLDGPGGRRTGVGLHHQLATAAYGLQNDLEDSYDNRPFNFRLDQGDLMIWAGQKVFVDSRVTLYHGEGEEDLLNLHNRARYAVRRPIENQPLSDREDIWKPAFDKYNVTHVVPRLSVPNPDYDTYFDLLTSPDWQPTHLGVSTAVFYRTDLANENNLAFDPELAKYLQEREFDLVETAFHEEPEQVGPRAVWPHSRSFYEKYLSLPETRTSTDLLRASHYFQHVVWVNSGVLPFSPQAMAAAYLTIRHAGRVLENDPQNLPAFRILGSTCDALGEMETIVARNGGGNFPSRRRYFQSVQAYGQALVINPEDLRTLRLLLRVYHRHNRLDLALDVLDRIRAATDASGVEPSEFEAEIRRTEQQLYEELSAEVDDVVEQVQEQREREVPPPQLANFAFQQGCVLLALEIVDQEGGEAAMAPEIQMFRSILLMEAGRVQEAARIMERMEGVLQEQAPGMQWRPQAAMTSLASANYVRAASLWMSEATAMEQRQMEAALDALPFVAESPLMFGRDADMEPLEQTTTAVSTLYTTPFAAAELVFEAALCDLERGDNKTASARFRRVLSLAPESPLRPLCRIYIFLISDEPIDPEPPSQWIPVTGDMFAAGEALEKDTQPEKQAAEREK